MARLYVLHGHHRTAKRRCHAQNDQRAKNIESSRRCESPIDCSRPGLPSPESPSMGPPKLSVPYSDHSPSPASRQTRFLLSESQEIVFVNS